MEPESLPRLRPRSDTVLLAAGVVVLPLWQGLWIDFDRSAALFALGPALWSGREELARSVAALWDQPRARLLLAWLGGAIGLSIGGSAHAAAAAVEAATWVFLAAAGLLAGGIARRDAREGSLLLAALALGSGGGIAASWTGWLLSGKKYIPIYLHYRLMGLHALPGALACVGLALRASSPGRRAAWSGLVGGVVWGGMFWSGGRAPILGAVAGLGAWVILLRPRPWRQFAAIVALQVAAGLVISLACWTDRAELGWWHAWSRTTHALAQGSVTELSSTRSEFWRETANRALRAPWTGQGPDSYRHLTPKLDGQQPHNFLLQLWLDLGVAGAAPALLILGAALRRGFGKPARSARPELAPWAAILAGAVATGLVDGVFYHLVAFIPAALALGVCLRLEPAAPVPAAPAPRRGALAGSAVLVSATLLLLLHSWLFYELNVAPPPSRLSAAPRILRRFPSTCLGLWHWLDAWQRDEPDAVREWLAWAEVQSSTPTLFRVYAARLAAAHGDRERARTELTVALAEAHWTARPQIRQMLHQLEPAAPPP